MYEEYNTALRKVDQARPQVGVMSEVVSELDISSPRGKIASKESISFESNQQFQVVAKNSMVRGETPSTFATMPPRRVEL
jgi:hypothetical protein